MRRGARDSPRRSHLTLLQAASREVVGRLGERRVRTVIDHLLGALAKPLRDPAALSLDGRRELALKALDLDRLFAVPPHDLVMVLGHPNDLGLQAFYMLEAFEALDLEQGLRLRRGRSKASADLLGECLQVAPL